MLRQYMMLVLAVLTASALTCHAQSNGVPLNILGRVLYLRNGDTTGTGTGFLIDYKDKEYLLTARHVVAGLALHNPNLQFYRSADWREISGDIIFPANKNVDIAVIDLHQRASLETSPELTSESPTIGGQVYFIGFPYGLHTLYSNGEYLPLVKAGVFSGLDDSDPVEIIYYVDGFNNPGFSGGPMVYIDNKTHTWRIVGVVQGYRAENVKTKVKGKDIDTGLLVNSGILIAYPVDYALKAIDGMIAK